MNQFNIQKHFNKRLVINSKIIYIIILIYDRLK